MRTMRKKKRWFAMITAGLVLAVILLLATGMQNRNDTVSMFSWHHEIEDGQTLAENKEVLEEYGVNRVYQLFSKSYIESPRMQTYMKNAAELGVSVVCLTGDKSWIYDGLSELKGIVDALAVYNSQAEAENQIPAIALDVECHTLPEWKENKKEILGKYIQLMKEAKHYANARNLKVIQVIPTYLDSVDEGLFEQFLLDCCDELSIMNYHKKGAASAIQTEYGLCVQHNIPIETVFELMPVNEERGVTEDITYYDDSRWDLWEDFLALKQAYGRELGMGLHHFSAIKEKYWQTGDAT